MSVSPTLPHDHQLSENANVTQLQASQSPQKNKRCFESSPSPETTRIDYPLLSHWFFQIDSDVLRGRDGQLYMSFVEPLEDAGIFRLDDFVGLNADELMSACVGMKIGTARRILRWAGEDISILKQTGHKKMHV
jgi:hypothetical protein